MNTITHTYQSVKNSEISPRKNNKLQLDCGVYMSSHGASQQGIMAGMSLGFSSHPRTILNEKKKLVKKSMEITVNSVTQAVKVRI